jgi:hypothetical protein
MLAISGARASRFSFADRFKQASGDLAPLILINPALQQTYRLQRRLG